MNRSKEKWWEHYMEETGGEEKDDINLYPLDLILYLQRQAS